MNEDVKIELKMIIRESWTNHKGSVPKNSILDYTKVYIKEINPFMKWVKDYDFVSEEGITAKASFIKDF
jgi:type 1 glutamine amidotransferase